MTTSHPSVSEARWRILRSALMGEVCPDDANHASIHRFAGWDLLRKSVADPQRDLSMVDCDRIDLLYHEILARQCFCGDEGSIQIQFPASTSFTEINSLREQLGRQGIHAKHPDDRFLMDVKWSYCSYVAMEYSLCQSTQLFIRERKAKRKVSVRELQSHDLNDGVDNTGQTRVWDSECTLTHCLLNKEAGLYKSLPILSKLSSTHTVVELGVGMAGIAGLALAKVVCTNILLTDGHPDAVDNNKVNIQMNSLLGNVQCERLLWSVDVQIHQEEADLVLCSDCTHFQEHHASLMITLANLLKIDGTAVLCQPPRAKSLGRFLTLCDSMAGLWDIKRVSEPGLERLHQTSLHNPSYDPNLHFPCLVVLRKLRPLETDDRNRARRMQCTRSPSPKTN